MIDVVIPFRSTSKEDLELRYTLRGIEQNLQGVDIVHIIGDFPKFGIGDNLNPVSHKNRGKMEYKERAIYEKILRACESRSVTDPFLYMNDDHFLLEEYEASEFPNYHGGPLYETGQRAGDNTYRLTVNNTLELLGPHALDFDIHCPILIHKDKFLKLANLNWDTGYGFAIKSTYAGLNGLEGEYMEDLKLKAPENYSSLYYRLSYRDWFSTGDKAINADMRKVFDNFYFNKSKYER